MRAAGQDQFLAGGEDVVQADGAGAVPPGLVVEAGFSAERVHQPGLALGLLPNRIQRFGSELLAGLGGVLGDEGAGLGLREVAQAQGLGGDVERAAAGDNLPGTGADAIVPDVPQAAQHHALRKARRALLIAGPQLPQHREQRVPHQGIDLINQ